MANARLHDGDKPLTYSQIGAAYAADVAVAFADSGSIDAFGRLRVSNPYTIFDSKQLYDTQPLFWDDAETSGGGTSSAHNAATAATTISVSATTAGKRVRQTFMRFNYQPGKSHLVLMTGRMSAGGAGITMNVGYFDDDNGLFFQKSGSILYAVRRTKTSGSVVDNKVAQSSWNLDTLDGNGPSGITLDTTATQIYAIDFEWLGVGRVRMGFVINGLIIYCHEFLHANVLSVVYMSIPNLPLRYSIENSGAGAAASLDHICSTVISEGGVERNGIIRSANNGVTHINANVVGDTYALIGLRLKSTHLAATINVILESTIALTADNYLWDIRFNPTVAGTFTYNDVSNSAVQVAKGDAAGNPSATTVTGGQVIRSEYARGNAPESAEILTVRHLGASLAGVRDTIVLCVTPLSANLDITGSLTWRELV